MGSLGAGRDTKTAVTAKTAPAARRGQLEPGHRDQWVRVVKTVRTARAASKARKVHVANRVRKANKGLLVQPAVVDKVIFV